MSGVGVRRYEQWYEAGIALCEAAASANTLVDTLYAQEREHELLSDGTDPSNRLRAMLEPRGAYWAERPGLAERAIAWVSEVERAIGDAMSAGDRLSLVRELAWLRHSTLPIVVKQEVPTVHLALRALEAEALSAISDTSRNSGSSFMLQSTYTSSAAFTARHDRKLFGKIYRLVRPGYDTPATVEVVETWQWSPDERVTLCLPLSVGCPNHCPTCEFGTYFGGQLRAHELLRLIEANLRANVAIPVNTRTTIYYLGGGDAGLHPELPELLPRVAERHPGIQQVVSTITTGSSTSLQRLQESAAATPGVGLQLSLCAMDEPVRALLTANARLMPLAEAAAYLHAFADASSRRGYVALMPLAGIYDDVPNIVRGVERHLDRDRVHVTLTMVRDNSLAMSRRRAPDSVFTQLRAALIDRGYACSISTNDVDPDNEVSCGRSDPLVLVGNASKAKRRTHAG